MKTTILIASVLVAAAISIPRAAGQPERGEGFFSILRPKQPVSINRTERRFEISMFAPEPSTLGLHYVRSSTR